MRILAMLVALMLLVGSASAESLLEENFALLESLGVEVPEEAQAAIEQNIADTLATMPEEIRAEFGYDRDSFSDITTVLAWLGYGELDAETWIHVPYTNDVYAFDAELFDLEIGYLELLDAVERLSGGEVEIEGCEVQISEELFMAGTGSFPISFSLNGQEYSYKAKLEYDWMDCGIIDYVNGVLQELGLEKQIWTMYDGGQGMILFYCGKEWAESFAAATLCELVPGTGENGETVLGSDILSGLLDIFF